MRLPTCAALAAATATATAAAAGSCAGRAAAPRPCRLAVEGDSISAVPSPVPGVTSWPALLALPAGCTTAVHAVSGTQTSAMVGRFDTYKDAGFSHLVLLGGVNDLRTGTTPLAETEANLSYLWAQGRARGMVVIAMTTTPQRAEASWSPALQRRQDALNAWIREQARAKSYLLVDAWAVLEDPRRPGALAPAFDAGDGLHPSTAGQRALARAVNAALGL